MANPNGNPSGFKKLADSLGNLLGAAGTVASTGAKSMGGAAQGSAGAAGRATSGAAGLVGTVVNTVANTARRFPKLSFVVGIYAGVKGIQHLVRKGKEKKEAALQAEMPPQQQMGESYDPRGFEQQYGQAQGGAQIPQQLSPEQEAFVRQMQQEAAMQQSAPAAAAQQPAAQGKWADQIAKERAQAGQHASQTR